MINETLDETGTQSLEKVLHNISKINEVQSRFTLRFIQATKSVLPVLRLNFDLKYISLVPFLRHGLLYIVNYTMKYYKI